MEIGNKFYKKYLLYVESYQLESGMRCIAIRAKWAFYLNMPELS